MSERWHITHRPRKFAQVLGQESIVRFCVAVLKQHYSAGKNLPVGLLFGGRSGVGKTTLARIVGASLNCENREGVEPCGKCPSCENIFAGVGGVREIDASFFGLVDNIRELRRQLSTYSVFNYQVVILDEAHMMSRESFNVLLKLLEEPPDKTMFILCTTEAHRVLETVRSRLSEFRFTSIEYHVVISYLKSLLKEEGVECEEKIYKRLYRLSGENLRDVIVSMEQLVQLGGGKITEKEACEVFGDVFVFEKVLNAIKLRDYGLAVKLYQQYAVFYTDFTYFLNGFLMVAGDYFILALKTGSSESMFFGSLFTSIYRFQSSVGYLKGEAAAKLFFHVLIKEVKGDVHKQVVEKKYVLEEKAFELLSLDK